MMFSKTIRVVSLALSLSVPALAQEGGPGGAQVSKPDAASVKSVWEFVSKGQGQGLVLADTKICTEIGKTGETQFECTQEVPKEGVKTGTTVYVWQAYLVPQGDKIEDVTIQVKHQDVLRETKDVKLEGKSWRTRTWNGVRLSKPGTWNLVILRGEEVLRSHSVTVTAS